MTRKLTPDELSRPYPSKMLALTVWDYGLGENVRGWEYRTLQEALDAFPSLEGGLVGDEVLILTGTDERGQSFDSYEPKASDTAASIRQELLEDAAEYRSQCASEGRWLAGSAFGNKGLADFGGLHLDN